MLICCIVCMYAAFPVEHERLVYWVTVSVSARSMASNDRNGTVPQKNTDDRHHSEAIMVLEMTGKGSQWIHDASTSVGSPFMEKTP